MVGRPPDNASWVRVALGGLRVETIGVERIYQPIYKEKLLQFETIPFYETFAAKSRSRTKVS
jgi:hypothetical protein